MMKLNFLSKLFHASLMCCLAVILTGCDELFDAIDNPIQTSISMATSDVKLAVGQTNQRKATTASPATVVYASADPAIATVDGNGVVTGVAAGTTTITASVAAVDWWTAASASYKVIVGDGSSSSATPNPGASTPADMKSTPLTLEAAEAGAIVRFTINVATGVEYSTDGENWSSYTSDTPITLAAIGDKVSFRGTNAAYSDGYGFSNISCDKYCYIYGNIMSLIKKEDFENVTTFTADYTFFGLFMNNAKIKNHTDATKYLVLPATKMTARCYQQMFDGCVGLTTTPVINVDCNAKECCMAGMFIFCTGLTTVAEGSKISGNMGESSCEQMFYSCSNLESVPSDLLPATSLADYCYMGMFYGCSKLTTVPVELPATDLKNYCYNSMFYGSASLTTAPKLPATTLASDCYGNMFMNCTSLNEVWVKAGYDSGACLFMFAGAAAGGTLHTDGNGWAAGTNLPTGWTITTYE